MLIGLVKWFDNEKGFGVVGTPNGEEYFLHINGFIKKPDKILKGTPISFSPKTDKNKKRQSAEKSRLIGKPEDWKLIFSHLGNSEKVNIEVEVTGRGRSGNFYHRKEIQSFSLIKMSLKYFLQDKSEEDISNYIINYFDNGLDIKHFISYCEILETNISNHFSIDKTAYILNKVFSHFGNNLKADLLFIIWKQKKFKFISYNEKDDYEIPESVLKAHILEIDKSELNRISRYSYGSDFCSFYVRNKFCNIETLTSNEIKKLYQYVEYEQEAEKEKRKQQIDNLYSQKIEHELAEKAKELGIIKTNEDYNNYNRLLQLIPNQLTEANKAKITKAIHKIIIEKCSDEFKPELLIKGVAEDVPFESVSKYFLDIETQTEKRIPILTKLSTDKQFELLKQHSNKYTFEKSFALLEGLVKIENSLSYYFNLLDVLFDINFWIDKKCADLIELFTSYVNNQSSDEQKYDLFLKGYVKNVPQNIVLKNIQQLEKDDCKKIFKNVSENKAFVQDILIQKVTPDNAKSLGWLYDLASEFLDEIKFNSFDKKVFDTIEQSEYFNLWETGKGKIIPHNKIDELLQDNYEVYSQIEKWIKNKVITKEEISEILFSYLQKHVLVLDRNIFHKQLNHIKYLLQLNELYLEKIKLIQNDSYNLILWALDKNHVFDYELLKRKFIYFTPDEQVRIIRKLFLLKATDQFDLTIEKLDALTRFDLDLYKTNLNLNHEIPVDISTDVIIKALVSFKNNNRFLLENDLFTIILNDLKHDKTRRFKLSNYFEDCLGRQTAKFNWSSEGEIRKVNFGNNQFYYAISFSKGETKWVNNHWGRREVFSPNPNFERLKEAVKRISGVKWNPNELHWGVPSQYQTEVLNFAKKYRFFLDFEGSNYANNTHLAEFMREGIPNGISFCEGRLANKPHELFKKEFWWCAGQPCFSKCETIHKSDEWERYTLLDFCEIFGLNTDETNKMGDYIPRGLYYQFISLINRFNRLLDKLYCQDCNRILYPSDFGTSHFAAHTVVRFQCRNEACSNNDEIYLNHCLNGQCNCIIDSRVSKRCDNGLFICENCGSCCSHNMLERRLLNLRLTGGHIHNNLEKCVNEKLGHLERAEYFCYKCKAEMIEISNDIFQCSNCNVKYDTTQYKFKRPHKHLRTIRTATGDSGNNEENNNDSFNLPF